MTISVLKLGHRPQRDKRVSTHLLLAARALGATNSYYTGIKDTQLETSIQKVCKEWGGQFPVKYLKNWRMLTKNWDGKIVHLTMYGLSIQDTIEEIRENKKPILIIVGGTKVPKEIYEISDWNVSITPQPHSEVSALAIFLHEVYQGSELDQDFTGARLKIIPKDHGKDVQFISKD
jgi:tRNA (cytidine56-2'-O)-methyltransferase